MVDLDDDPVTLADAAARFHVTKGILMAEGKRGNLSMFRLGKSYYTTPNAIREWVQKCRVEPKARACISTRAASSGLSETAQISCEQDALNRTLQGLRNI